MLSKELINGFLWVVVVGDSLSGGDIFPRQVDDQLAHDVHGVLSCQSGHGVGCDLSSARTLANDHDGLTVQLKEEMVDHDLKLARVGVVVHRGDENKTVAGADLLGVLLDDGVLVGVR